MCQNTTQIERAVLHSMGIHIYTSNIVIHRSHVVPTPKNLVAYFIQQLRYSNLIL